MSIKVKIKKNKKNNELYVFFQSNNTYITVNSQIQEMNIFQQTLLDLERTQQVLKKQLRVFFHCYYYLLTIYTDMKRKFLD